MMARGSIGVKLIVGVVKAINKANKEDQNNRLRAARESESQLKKLRQIRAREEKENERLIESEAKDHERYLLAKQKRIEKEHEKMLADEEKEKQLKIKDAEQSRIQSEKVAKRNAELLLKELINREKAEFELELSQGIACLINRCNVRRNLRLDYIRRLLK